MVLKSVAHLECERRSNLLTQTEWESDVVFGSFLDSLGLRNNSNNPTSGTVWRR